MDNFHGFPTQQSWSAAQLEEVRTFLQTTSQIPSTNSAQKVPQPPHRLNASPAGSSSRPSPLICPVPDGMTAAMKFPKPEFNSMVYDPGTGYRFDRTTGLYYDANAGLFINKRLNVLLHWNQDKSAYTLVGKASDVVAPVLAGDLAQLMKHGLTSATNLTLPRPPTVTVPTLSTIRPAPKPPIPSSQASTRDMPPFQRERSLSFEEMSPDRYEVASDKTGRVSRSSQQSSHLSKNDVLDRRDRRRSLSFDEMTPERETDTSCIVPRENRNPSYDRSGLIYDSLSSSPRSSQRPKKGRVLPNEKYSPDVMSRLDNDSNWERNPGEDSSGRKSPWRGSSGSPRRDYSIQWRDSSRSPRRDYSRPWRDSSRSPRRDYSRSPRQDYPRGPSPIPLSYRLHTPERQLSPRRGFGLSPSPVPLQQRRLSPDHNRGHSPERGTRRRFSPDTGPRWRLNPERCDSGGGRSHRSPSPTNQLAGRRKNVKTERGENVCPNCSAKFNSAWGLRTHQRNCGVRKEDTSQKSSNTGSRSRTSRSRSRSRPEVDQQTTRIQSKTSKNPLDGRKTAQDDPKQAVSKLVDVSNPAPSCSKNEAPTRGYNQVGEATKAGGVALLRGSAKGRSPSFMAENVYQIHKRNMRNPANLYGHILPPNPVHTLFIMLTPLPQKGDRDWEDLEILLKGMLEGQGVCFNSVAVFTGDCGAPLNYCLIRFKNTEEAFRWYMAHEGTIDLAGPDGSRCTVFMNFMQNNWTCKQCKTQNFSLRHFCHKCFWFTNRSLKSPIQVSQLVTSYVGIAGLDCRFSTVQEVFVGFPPLDSFNVETFELLAEPNGIPLGLCVFKFKEQQESAVFYRFLQESCLNPIFIQIVDRTGLGDNRMLGNSLKDIASLEGVHVPSKLLVKNAQVLSRIQDEVTEVDDLKFAKPPETDPGNNSSLWWRYVAGYDPKKGYDIMKHLFEKKSFVDAALDWEPPVILIGPLPMPLVCDITEYRNMLSLFLQRTGVIARTAEKIAICKAHHFGAPYTYGLLTFINKILSKEWFEKNKGKLVLNLEDGSTWPVYLHYSKPNWLCDDCHKLNFPIRNQCFFCYKSRLPDHTPVNLRKEPTDSIGITGYQNWCVTKELLFKKLPFLRETEYLTIRYLNEPTGVPLGICVIKSKSRAASVFRKLQDALKNEIARTSIQEPNRPLLVYIDSVN